MWRCGICETLNEDKKTRCVVCDTPRPGAEPEESGRRRQQTQPPHTSAASNTSETPPVVIVKPPRRRLWAALATLALMLVAVGAFVLLRNADAPDTVAVVDEQEALRARYDEHMNNGEYAAARDVALAMPEGDETRRLISNTYYNEAISLYNDGDYAGAQAALAYCDSDELGLADQIAEALAADAPAESAAAAPVGAAQEQLAQARLQAAELARGNGAGYMHSVWIENGLVMAEGNNYFGQCAVDGWTDVVQVAAGRYHTVGLRADGTVVAVGSNEQRQCNVDGWTDIVAIAAGGYHTVGLKSDGTVVAVGVDRYGQCGVHIFSDVVAIAAGENHTAALMSDGTVTVVGDNSADQRETGDWNDVVAVACGYMHTVGLKADGAVVAVGRNDYGQCDVGALRDAIAIDAGVYHTVALSIDGGMRCVGDSYYGQNAQLQPGAITAVSANGVYTMQLLNDGRRHISGEYYQQLAQGSTGDDVMLLQRALADGGYYSGALDGSYSEAVAQAVAAAQEAMGLPATGVADPAFLEMLYNKLSFGSEGNRYVAV